MNWVVVHQPNGGYAIYDKEGIDFYGCNMSRKTAMIQIAEFGKLTEGEAYVKIREAELNRGRYEQCMSNILATKNGRGCVWQRRQDMQFTAFKE